MAGTLPLPLRLEGELPLSTRFQSNKIKDGFIILLRCHGLPQARKMSRSMPGSPSCVQRPTKSSRVFSAVSVRLRRKKTGRSARLPIFWSVEFTSFTGAFHNASTEDITYSIDRCGYPGRSSKGMARCCHGRNNVAKE